MSESDLTYKEKSYLQRLFWDHQDKLARKMQEEINILSKYKGKLASNYDLVGENQKVLTSYVKDIIDVQESIAANQNQIMILMSHLENFFLNDKKPSVLYDEHENT